MKFKKKFTAILTAFIMALSFLQVQVSVADDQTAFMNEMFMLINQARAANGLSPVMNSPKLNEIAVERCHELIKDFSEWRPDGRLSDTILDDNNIAWSRSMENFAKNYKTPQAVTNAWLSDSYYASTILDPYFNYVGVGCILDGKTYYWVQIFITSSTSPDGNSGEIITPEPPATTTTAPEITTTAPPTTTTAPSTTTTAPSTTTTAPPTTTTAPPTTTTAPSTTAPSTPTPLSLGDISGDGAVDASDAAMLLTESVLLGAGQPGEFNSAQNSAADINKDNKIDASDAAIILQYAAAAGSGEKRPIGEWYAAQN